MALRWAAREFPHRPVRILIDNQQVVDTASGPLRGTLLPNTRNASWEGALESFMLEHPHRDLDFAWIKGHAGFLGNVIANHYAGWASHALAYDRSLLPAPALGTLSCHGLPVLHTFRARTFTSTLDKDNHSNIKLPQSFDFYKLSSCFAGLPFKFATGN